MSGFTLHAQGRKSFHKVHKHHMFVHLIQEAKYLNPRFHWCFKAEDYVGHLAKLTHSVSMGVRSTRLSQKLAAKYQAASADKGQLCVVHPSL